MVVIAALELRFKPDSLDAAREVLADVLATTRAFEGCRGVEVLIDAHDPAHWIAHEVWESMEHDAAYRAFRETAEGSVAGLGPLLAGAPVLTHFTVADGI